jgi:hypothetical protein
MKPASFKLDAGSSQGQRGSDKGGGNSVRIFEEQLDGKWLAKVHIYNLY